MKTILSVLTLLIFSTFTFAQTTAIPDANFEQALINLGLDTGTPDGTVPTANIDTATVLFVTSNFISDLTGIEDFTALTYLICDTNQLTSLDVTNNLALIFLQCNNNLLTSLDVTNNIALVNLFCFGNPITSLNVTNNTALIQLSCGNSQLTSLDVTNNTALIWLHCSDNQLTSLDVTNNIALTTLVFGSNQLTNLDVTNNTALVTLEFSSNQITSLNLANNIALQSLRFFNNPLNCLNIKNGNNINMNNFNFDARLNPNLTCIEVDDVTYSDTTWTQIDAQTSFSTNCNNACSPVGIEENTLSQLSIYPNPTIGSINIDLEETESNISLRLINALGQIVLTKNYTSTNHINFDIDAPKGLYFLQLETSNGKTQTLKVIKE